MPRRPKRVLHVAPYLWSGAGSVITRLIESQVDRHEVVLVTSPASGELRNWPAYARRVAKAVAWHPRIDVFHRDGASLWTAVGKMREVFDEFEPDVVHAHAGTPTAVAVLTGRAMSRPAPPIVSHFYSWGLGRPAWMNDMDLWAFGRADAVICSARAYQRILRTGGVAGNRLRLIPWGLSAVHVPAAARRGDVPLVGTLGRIERRKGQLALVHAFARLTKRWPDARLEIVGPVAERDYAREIGAAIRRLGLGDRVCVTGHVGDPARHVARWSAYVSLSSDEGQGLAVLEAMSHGVPVVALQAPGVEDYLLDGRTGLSVASAAPRAVARQIARLLGDVELAGRLARTARRMVRRRFSWQHTVDEIEAIYTKIA